jgi:hypothetical protein
MSCDFIRHCVIQFMPLLLNKHVLIRQKPTEKGKALFFGAYAHTMQVVSSHLITQLRPEKQVVLTIKNTKK